MDWKNACEVVSAALLSWLSVPPGTAGACTVPTLPPLRFLPCFPAFSP